MGNVVHNMQGAIEQLRDVVAGADKQSSADFQYAADFCNALFQSGAQDAELVEQARRILDVFDVHLSDPLFPMLRARVAKNTGNFKAAYDFFLEAAHMYDMLSENAQCPQDVEAPIHAVRAFQEAFEIEGKDPKLASEISSRYQSLDRVDLALHYAEQAQELAPEAKATQFNLTSLYLLNGEHEKGRNEFLRLQKKYPEEVFTFYQLSNVPDFVGSEEFEERLLQAARISRSPEDLLLTSFTLGRSLHSRGEHESAIAAFKKANEIERVLMPDSTFEQLRSEIDGVKQIKEHARPELFNECASPDVHETFKPIFILGMPRSGTSLIERILASHSREDHKRTVVAGGENLMFMQASDVVKVQGMDKYILNGIRTFYLRALEKQYDLAEREGVRYVSNKTPQNFHKIALIQFLFPDAPIIHCVRNPMDTCMSLYFRLMCGAGATHMAFKTDLNILGEYYTQYYQEFMRLWDDVLPEGRIHTVSYENLVSNTEEEVGSVLDYCELPWSDSCLRHEKNTIGTAYDFGTAKPIYSSQVGWSKVYEKYVPELVQWFS